MKTYKFISWNVNGIRALAKKGFADFLNQEAPNFLAIQETKAHEDQLPFDLKAPSNYTSYFVSGERRGYSGVATYADQPAMKVIDQLGVPRFDNEGRQVILEYPDFYFCNIYFPNGRRDLSRLQYKLEYYETFLKFVNKLKQTGKAIIICGDVNTAHNEIDLFHPKENSKSSGFLPEERAWLDKFIAAGFEDVYRNLHPEARKYTWWDQKSRARTRDIGWRIDYFFIDSAHAKNVISADIMTEVMGSDHCPISLNLSI
jgi:exodeoxyribonuclease-3